MWPEIIRKSKEGGLDVIETYVFWNYHEPEKGQVGVGFSHRSKIGSLKFDLISMLTRLCFCDLAVLL